MERGKYNKIIFNETEIQFIKENFLTMTNDAIAEALKCKNTTVRTFAYSLGLKKMILERWTSVQIAYLKRNYKTKGDKELVAIFEVKFPKIKTWTTKHIAKKRGYLKLYRTPEQLRAIKDKAIKTGVYSKANYLRWKDRQAKEGEKRVWFNSNNRPFVVIKTKIGFTYYSRWLWKKHHGEIPKGMNVRIVGPDIINYTIIDLQLISDAENAKLNTINRVPPEYKEALKLIKQIKRKITPKTIAQ